MSCTILEKKLTYKNGTMSNYLNVGYVGTFHKCLPLGGEDGEVIIIKTGEVYIWKNNGWKQLVTTDTFFFLNLNNPCLYEVRLKCEKKFKCACKRNVVFDCMNGKIYKKDKKQWIEICDLKSSINPPIFNTITYTFSSGTPLILRPPSFLGGQAGLVGASSSTNNISGADAWGGTVNVPSSKHYGLLIGKKGTLKNLYVKFTDINPTGNPGDKYQIYGSIFVSKEIISQNLIYNSTPLSVNTELLPLVDTKLPVHQNLTEKVTVSPGDHIALVVYLPNLPPSVHVKLSVSAQVELEYKV